MRTTLVIVAILGCGALSGVSGAAEPEPVTQDQVAREEFAGFSIAPPASPQWARHVASRVGMPEPLASSLAIWRAQCARPEHTALMWISAEIGDIRAGQENEFLQNLERSLREVQDTGRLHRTSYKVERDSTLSRYGLRYQFVVEDRKVRGYQGTFEIIESHFLILHPDAPCYGIEATFSERTPPGLPPEFAAADAETFLKSLKLSRLPARMSATRVSGVLQAVAVTESAVWVTDGVRSLFRIDPVSLRTVATIRVGRGPTGVSASETGVWVANKDDGTVSRVDPHTNVVVASVKVGKQPLEVATGAGSVWVTNSGSGSLSRIDPRTNLVDRTILLAGDPTCVAVEDSAIWVTSYRADALSRIDPATNAVVATIPVRGGPNYVSASRGRLWVASQGERSLSRVDRATNAVAIRAPLGFVVGGLAQVGDTLWVADFDIGRLVPLDAASGVPLGTSIPVQSRPIGLEFRGRTAWIAGRGTAVVSRLDF